MHSMVGQLWICKCREPGIRQERETKGLGLLWLQQDWLRS